MTEQISKQDEPSSQRMTKQTNKKEFRAQSMTVLSLQPHAMLAKPKQLQRSCPTSACSLAQDACAPHPIMPSAGGSRQTTKTLNAPIQHPVIAPNHTTCLASTAHSPQTASTSRRNQSGDAFRPWESNESLKRSIRILNPVLVQEFFYLELRMSAINPFLERDKIAMFCSFQVLIEIVMVLLG